VTQEQIPLPHSLIGADPRFVSRRTRLAGVLVVFAMSLAVILVYLSPPYPNTVLIGADYLQLHSRRMQFARDALFSSSLSLPAWYPRELLGTPFWSNLQNFPFIPTRLLILLTMDPLGPYSHAVAVTLSALLAALFTFLFLRKIGLRLTACAAGGWTFACSGFYAARVAAGHLPLLEAYPALPLLLWLIESHIQQNRRGESTRRWITAIAVSSACVMLAGHPQLSIYSMIAAGLYVLWRGGIESIKPIWSAMIVGVGCSAFALVPMGMLIGRSTRLLALGPAANDVAMPYGRLAAFFLPWRDGVPPLLDNNPANAFHGYPNLAYFWDTVCYIGIVPWLAVLLILFSLVRIKSGSDHQRIAKFIIALGVIGIVMSLPIIQQAGAFIPGTIFRSPARLLYFTEFALAVALAGAIHMATSTQTMVARLIVSILLTLHVIDLGSHDRRFIQRGSLLPAAESAEMMNVLKSVSESRVAIDHTPPLPLKQIVDDVGFFDSIMLARPYRMILSLTAAPENLNIQILDGSEMSLRALAAMGVQVMFTPTDRKDLTQLQKILGINIYKIPTSTRRAAFFPRDQIRYLSTEQIHAALRDSQFDLSTNLLLPRQAMVSEAEVHLAAVDRSPKVEYRRPDSDHIECTVDTQRPGYLRVIESWDPGWSATVNGLPVSIIPALDALLAVPIGPGRHEVRFVYRTPGAMVGQLISIFSLALLCGLVWLSGARKEQSAMNCRD
jgi:hypothetical protein